MQKKPTNLRGLPPVAFIDQASSELKKVTWPSRKQVIRLSSVVVVASLFTGIFLGVLDYTFVSLLSFLLK